MEPRHVVPSSIVRYFFVEVLYELKAALELVEQPSLAIRVAKHLDVVDSLWELLQFELGVSDKALCSCDGLLVGALLVALNGGSRVNGERLLPVWRGRLDVVYEEVRKGVITDLVPQLFQSLNTVLVAKHNIVKLGRVVEHSEGHLALVEGNSGLVNTRLCGNRNATVAYPDGRSQIVVDGVESELMKYKAPVPIRVELSRNREFEVFQVLAPSSKHPRPLDIGT